MQSIAFTCVVRNTGESQANAWIAWNKEGYKIKF